MAFLATLLLPCPWLEGVYQEVWQYCIGEGFADRRGKAT